MVAAPALSVVVLADRFVTIRRLVEHLRAQTIADRIELVVACPFPAGFAQPTGANGLARIAVVETPLLPMGPARAAAVRAAKAPVVVLGEAHAFPEPDWAERLVEAHRAQWGGVAPGLRNANPEGALSWAGFLMDYGRWLAEAPSNGEIRAPPTYNGSWKRDALLTCGESLPQLLDLGTPLEADLAARGERFAHEPRARVAHLNVARPGPWAAERYFGGRLFAACRSRRWSVARRILYASGFFLVPPLRLLRTYPASRVARLGSPLPRGTLLAVALGSALWALGEAVGYLAGAGHAEARMLEYEMHKERFA